MEPKLHIGQPVIYQLTDADRERYKVDSAECPAIVVRVFTNSCANLRLLLDNDGEPPRHTSVSKGSEPGFWSWGKSPITSGS